MQESRLKAPSYPPPTASCRKESKTPAPQQALDSNREQLTQTVGSTDIPRLPLTLAARGEHRSEGFGVTKEQPSSERAEDGPCGSGGGGADSDISVCCVRAVRSCNTCCTLVPTLRMENTKPHRAASHLCSIFTPLLPPRTPLLQLMLTPGRAGSHSPSLNVHKPLCRTGTKRPQYKIHCSLISDWFYIVVPSTLVLVIVSSFFSALNSHRNERVYCSRSPSFLHISTSPG